MSCGKRIADMCISEKCNHTAEGTAEKQVETYRNGEADLENEKNDIVPVNKRRGRKTLRKVKKRENEKGKEYLTLKGKKNLGKKVKEACSCRQKCFEKFLEIERLEMFRDFYNLSLEAQNQFIANLIDEQNKKIERKKTDGKESRRKYSRKYHLLKNASRINVCQIMFLNTFDLTLKKVRVITEKKILSESGICAEDRRGKHSNHPKVPNKDREEIRRHIKMFPSYESHYSRSHTKKQYLSPDLSISKMYRLYVTYCLEKNITPRNEALYRKIFVEEFNLSFDNPANDTCGTCDKYNLLLKSASNDGEKEWSLLVLTCKNVFQLLTSLVEYHFTKENYGRLTSPYMKPEKIKIRPSAIYGMKPLPKEEGKK
ncbi:hypothetical protein JTB14_016705 [Gonioctena quinquepunctata]|nr:hypothetical protein JTB14_016705 [Gonioctena quinquepunctata]